MRKIFAALIVLATLTMTSPSPAAAVDIPSGSGFSAAQQREIERAVAAATDPVLVRVFAQLPPQDFGSASQSALRLLQTTSQIRARAVVWGGPQALPAFGVAGDSDAYCAVEAVQESPFDEHQQFVELVRLVAAGTGCQAMDEALADRFRDLGTQDRSGGRVVEPADATTWLLRALVITVVLLLVGALVFFWVRSMRDARLRKRRGEEITGFASQAAHHSAGEQAHADLLAFGEALDATEMLGSHLMQYWQLALDEYAEACRLHDRGTREYRRVIGLCASGRRHLAQATGAKTI